MSEYPGFYRAFEEQERGSRELILSRLAVYRPVLETVLTINPQPMVVDIGCGRGEWLELLASLGIEGLGIDLDAGMLEACRERGMAVEQADGIAWLEEQPDDSLALISAFHLVEHLPFSRLQRLVEQAKRTLQPGGLLIMETPNPENLSVGAHTFYLDPTHQRPIPPALLAFVPRFFGFTRSTVWRLQATAREDKDAPSSLKDVLLGISPDYAVLAQKQAAADIVACFDEALDRPRELDLGMACDRFDQGLASGYRSSEARAERIKSDVEHVRSDVEHVRSDVEHVKSDAEQIKSNMGARFNTIEQAFEETREQLAQQDEAVSQLTQRLEVMEWEVRAVYQSRSWRVTAPLRWVADQARRGKRALWKGRPHKLLLRRLGLHLVRRPILRRTTLAVLNHLPRLKARLRRLMYSAAPGDVRDPDPSEADLNPRARRILAELESTIEDARKGGR